MLRPLVFEMNRKLIWDLLCRVLSRAVKCFWVASVLEGCLITVWERSEQQERDANWKILDLCDQL